MPVRKQIEMPFSKRMFDQLGIVEAVSVGNTVHVSGQVGWDQELKPAPTLEAQAKLAFQNLKAVLEKAGAAPRHITHLQLFFVDREGKSLMDMAGVVFNAKSEVMPECRPAATGVRVAELVLPELMLEVQATAVIAD